MIRVVIAEDEELARERVRDLVLDHPRLELVGEACDGRAAVELVQAQQPDLLLLDIQMPELDGFQVLDAITGDSMPAVIFITAYDEYAIRAFAVRALDYLLKPIVAERFHAAIERVGAPLATRFVALRNGRHYFVPVSEVHWIEADGNYVRICTSDASHLVRDTMKSVEARLDASRFVRVHRSAIVAVDRVQSIEAREQGEYELTMARGEKLISSRSYSARVRALLR